MGLRSIVNGVLAVTVGHLYLRDARQQATTEAHARVLGALRSMVTSQGERLSEAAEEARRANEIARARATEIEVNQSAIGATIAEALALPKGGESLGDFQERCPHAYLLSVMTPSTTPASYTWDAKAKTWVSSYRIVGDAPMGSIDAAWPLVVKTSHEATAAVVAAGPINVIDASERTLRAEVERLAAHLNATSPLLLVDPHDARAVVDAAIARLSADPLASVLETTPTPLAAGQTRANLDGNVVRVGEQDGRFVLRPIVSCARPFPIETRDLAAAYPIVLAGPVRAEEEETVGAPVILGQQRVGPAGDVVAVDAQRGDAYVLRSVTGLVHRTLDAARVRCEYPIVLRRPVAPVDGPRH